MTDEISINNYICMYMYLIINLHLFDLVGAHQLRTVDYYLRPL